MKSNCRDLSRLASFLGAASLLLGAGSLRADDTASSVSMIVPAPTLRSGAYAVVDAGLNLPDDLANSHGSISLNSGVRCDLSVGYAFKIVDQLTIAPAAEVGIIYDSTKTASFNGTSKSASGSFYQVPVLADLILNWEFYPHCVFYAGGGAGVEYNKLNATGIVTGRRGISTDVLNGEAAFAWQALFGFRYTFGANEVSVGYKYLGTQPSGLNALGNHAIMAAYSVHF